MNSKSPDRCHQPQNHGKGRNLPTHGGPGGSAWSRWSLIQLGMAVVLLFTLAMPGAVWAADLRVNDVALEPCPEGDAGRQPELHRPAGATCYVLRGRVNNPFSRPIVDTDVYAVVVDASGEAVLPNRTRVGSIGDVPVGDSDFALRMSIPAGTPGPFEARKVRARGFNAPVRARAGDDDELLPLEMQVADTIPADALNP